MSPQPWFLNVFFWGKKLVAKIWGCENCLVFRLLAVEDNGARGLLLVKLPALRHGSWPSRILYHLESRWRNVPCIWFIITPYIVDTFGEWLAIYFHHGVTHPTKGEKENHLEKYVGMGYVIVPWRVSNPSQFVRFLTSPFFHSSIITTFVYKHCVILPRRI